MGGDAFPRHRVDPSPERVEPVVIGLQPVLSAVASGWRPGDPPGDKIGDRQPPAGRGDPVGRRYAVGVGGEQRRARLHLGQCRHAHRHDQPPRAPGIGFGPGGHAVHDHRERQRRRPHDRLAVIGATVEQKARDHARVADLALRRQTGEQRRQSAHLVPDGNAHRHRGGTPPGRHAGSKRIGTASRAVDDPSWKPRERLATALPSASRIGH